MQGYRVLLAICTKSAYVNLVADIDRHHVLTDFNRTVVVLANQWYRRWAPAVREDNKTRLHPRENLTGLNAVGVMVRHFPPLLARHHVRHFSGEAGHFVRPSFDGLGLRWSSALVNQQVD